MACGKSRGWCSFGDFPNPHLGPQSQGPSSVKRAGAQGLSHHGLCKHRLRARSPRLSPQPLPCVSVSSLVTKPPFQSCCTWGERKTGWVGTGLGKRGTEIGFVRDRAYLKPRRTDTQPQPLGNHIDLAFKKQS